MKLWQVYTNIKLHAAVADLLHNKRLLGDMADAIVRDGRRAGRKLSRGAVKKTLAAQFRSDIDAGRMEQRVRAEVIAAGNATLLQDVLDHAVRYNRHGVHDGIIRLLRTQTGRDSL